MSFIELKGVVKTYKMGEIEIKAADNISFPIEKGEFVVVVGPSGAGKTTVLNILGGMDKATSGEIMVDGTDIGKFTEKELTKYRRDDVGFVFQFYNLVQNLTALENVELASQMKADALDAEDVLAACDTHTKVIWICTPNNPSGNDICRSEIEHILNTFQGIVVIDEAYSDFSQQKTFRTELSTYPNMIVLNTMSKAWGCAGIRLGMAFASHEIIGIFNKVKYPYNVNCLTQEKAAALLDNIQEVQIWVAQILEEKARVIEAFGQLDVCVKIYPSAANFFLVEVTDAQSIYDYLVNKGIIVRNRSQIALCKNCLRITIGNRTENNELLAALRVYK